MEVGGAGTGGVCGVVLCSVLPVLFLRWLRIFCWEGRGGGGDRGG